MTWRARIAAALLAGTGIWCQMRIAASARWNASAAKGLLLHYDAPALVGTVLLLGLLALTLSVFALRTNGRSGFLLVSLVGSTACASAASMASNWRVFTDTNFDTLLATDQLHPVVALATYPWFFGPAVGVELLIWLAAVFLSVRDPTGG